MFNGNSFHCARSKSPVNVLNTNELYVWKCLKMV